jgi:hypothetical protein
MKVSACVDCGTTILGERLRCPAHHDEHARELEAIPPLVEVTGSPLRTLFVLLVGMEVLVVIGCLVLLAVKSCT